MHKKILVLLTGAIALSISAIPVLASDPPTDDGQYIWQDENGDYWYRNGSEDEYIGEGNYAPDPDSGELMEGNDAGWTEQDGYFEPHYYYEDGSVWLEDATGTTYIGSRDKYYIDDYGNLQEYSDSETDSSSGDSSEESSDTSGNSSSQDSGSSYPNSSSDTNAEESSESEKRGELHMRVDSLPMIRSENPCPKRRLFRAAFRKWRKKHCLCFKSTKLLSGGFFPEGFSGRILSGKG